MSRHPRGFFLVVEGSQIDWAGHQNDIVSVMSELDDFVQAVEAALDFARRDGRKLVVVTADHATGGLTIGKGGIYQWDPTTAHTGEDEQIYAFGPGKVSFAGLLDNTDTAKNIFII